MYKELLKYKTGEKIDAVGVLPNKKKMKIKLDEYSFPLGDLIADYTKHLSKPFWRRTYYHNHLTKIYKEVLNKVVIVDGL